ncbi:hypothetical protein F511_23856 [Dorcoceras hygrometricum]|uniref:Dystroglycan-like n=1 Tax=Dorcoceras hygrometricum TaxID=472368 RepID=A0A2Z7AZZ1_9LAMI|nr:hypothetical protein F511_23856 [Dorcoceras hygrometricum]
MAEESTKNWAEIYSDSSSSSSSSSDSEQEEVHFLMANQTSDDEVFDFSNVEFTREDLVSALNDMVKEYRKLSHSFEEIKAENENLKNSAIESSTDTLEDIDSLKIELSKLMMENELLRNESSELKAEIEKSNLTMRSWAKSSTSLDKLFGILKPASDRTGLGFNSSHSSDGETSTQSQLVYDKFNKMSFVKSNVIYDPCESMTYDDQTSHKLNHKGKAGIGFQKPEISKPSWLKKKLDNDKAKVGRKSFVPNQSWRSSTKVKSGWKRVQPKCDLNDQNMKSKLNRSHNFAQTLTDSSTGKTVKAFSVTYLSEMASSLFVNTVHIFFDSVLAMDNQGMVAMFEYLVATGLKGFLGCPVVIHEAALLEFFENGSVRDGLVVSTVNGVAVEISEQLLAETFKLPVEGLSDLSEISKELVVDARSIVSLTGEPVSMSGKKKEMKIEFRLLCDIMAKTISVNAGSFDAITQEKFLMIAGITCGVQVNWNKILFNILKDMVTTETRQARGYAIQISLLLENFPNLELGEATEFPSSKILTEKIVHRYIILNDKVGGEDVTDAPRPVVAGVEGKQAETAASSVTVETIVESVAEPVSEPAVAEVVNKGPSTTDDVDDIIQQEDRLVEKKALPTRELRNSNIAPRNTNNIQWPWVNHSAHGGYDPRREMRVRYYRSPSQPGNPGSTAGRGFNPAGGAPGDVVLGTNVGVQTEASPDENLVKEPMEAIEEKLVSADKAMSLEDILLSIPLEVRLPSTGVEVTNITLGKSIKIPGVDERTWYMASLPQIPVDDKGKKPLLEKDPVKGNLVKEQFLLMVVDIDLLVQLREQIIDEVAKFFYSFSLKRLANLKIDDSYYAKEELVLSWAEAESTGVALQRRMYILLKYRELLIRKFLEARKINFAPGDGSSATDLKILDWLSDLHLFVLEELKEQSLVHGLRWDKTTMLRVDGTWVIEPCADYWKPIPRGVISSMVVIPSWLSYVDTLPPMSEFFKLMKKRWGDVCIEVAKFFASVATSPFLPTVSTEVQDVLAQLRASVAHIQVELLRHKDDVDKIRETISLHIHDLERKLTERFDTHDRTYRVLFNNVRHDMRDHKNLLSLDLTTYQQKVSNQVGAAAFDVVDVRMVVKELDAKVAVVATGLDDVRKDVEATKEAISHQILDFRAQAQENYNILTVQLSELVAYVNRGGNDKKGEDSSIRGPQPPPDDQGRPGEGSASRGSGSGGDGRRRGDSDRSSKHRRSGESPPRNIRYGPYPPSGIQKKSAPWWLYGEKEF